MIEYTKKCFWLRNFSINTDSFKILSLKITPCDRHKMYAKQKLSLKSVYKTINVYKTLLLTGKGCACITDPEDVRFTIAIVN